MTVFSSPRFVVVLRLCAVIALLLGLTASQAIAAGGDLDPTFGGGGAVVTDISGNDSANAVVVQPDGRIITAGSSADAGSDFALVRYLDTGGLDGAFGNAGQVITYRHPMRMGSQQ